MDGNKTAYTDEETAILKLLIVIANEKLAVEGPASSQQFNVCINSVRFPSSVVKQYARCLIKLLKRRQGRKITRRKNQKDFILLDKSSSTFTQKTFDATNFVHEFLVYLSETFKIFNDDISTSPDILSPSILPLKRESNRENVKQILSPEIFSFYESNDTNNILSLPSIFKGIPINERDSWINFLNQTLTVFRSEIQRQVFNTSEIRSVFNDALFQNVSHSSLNNVRSFFGTLSTSQLDQLSRRGYSFLESGQLNKVNHYIVL